MFGALAAIIGALVNAGGQSQANATQQQALEYQKERDREQTRQAQATRIDAYGNTTKYNPDTNTWEIIMTPMQRRIADAMQSNELQSQTVDATRARDLRGRQEVRSKQADELYKKALLDYQYKDQPYSEGAYASDAQGDIVRATDEAQAGPRADVARLALRAGQGQDLNSLLHGINSGSGSPGLAASILAGKEAGSKRYQTAMGNKYAKLGGPVAGFEKIADDIGGYSDLQSNSPGQLAGTESSMAAAIQAALGGGASRVGSAYDSLSSSLGKGIDFSGIINAMMALDKQHNGGTLNAGIADPGGSGGGGSIFSGSGGGTPLSGGSSVKDRTYGLGGGYDYAHMDYNF